MCPDDPHPEVDASPEVPLPTPSDAKAAEWVTALCAAGFDYRLDHTNGGWIIYLPADVAAAVDRLAADPNADVRAAAAALRGRFDRLSSAPAGNP